jgi:fibronectin type 3 domain-containing protein
LCFAAGCGYIGSPLPPFANVPSPVANLAAVQRGDKIVAQFTVPTLTTEGQPLKPPVTLDLRIGERRFTPAAVKDGIARYEIPSAEWTGKDAVITARVVGANGKVSAWPVTFTVPVVAPPEVPRNIAAESTAKGVRLTWQAKGAHFHVLRMAGAETEYKAVAADVAQTEWVDATAEFGKPYSYLVQTFVPLPGGKEAQSDLPEARSITPEAPLPGVPTGLRAVPAAASIELSWDTPEGAAPAGYRVYRAVAGGEFAGIGEAGAAPAYSDRRVEAGIVYRYAVCAIDASGREGPRTAAVEAGLQ